MSVSVGESVWLSVHTYLRNHWFEIHQIFCACFLSCGRGSVLLWQRCDTICTSGTSGWLGSRVVSVLDLGAVGPGFKSQPRRCRVTVLGKLFSPLSLCSPSSEIGSSPLKAWRKVMAAYRRVYDSRHLQADCKEPGSAPEPSAH